MNKKYYTDTFSKLHPSNETVERIFDMAEKKKVKFCRKTVLAIIAVLSIFVATCICANAATDGKLKEEVKNIINSKTVTETEAEAKPDYDHIAKRETIIDENGNKAEKLVIKTLDGKTVGECVLTSSYKSENWDDDMDEIFNKSEYHLKLVRKNQTETSYDIVFD